MATTSIDRARLELRDWWRALLRGEAPLPGWIGALAVASLLGVSWLATYSLGGAGSVAPHWYYLPILVAAARFGFPGAGITAVVAGIIGGPFTPLDVDAGTRQSTSDWLSRAGFFLAIGIVMAWLVERLQSALRRELDLRRQEHELAQRSAAVIQSVGHEFRTPLTVLTGTIDVLRTKTLDPDDVTRFADGMQNAVQRLNNLIDVVIATSEAIHTHQASVETVDLTELCHDIAGELDALGGPARVAVPDQPVRITAHPRLLRVAMRALLENALKFSQPDSPVAIRATSDNDRVDISIRDHGPGIDLDIAHQSLTTPFAPERATAASGGGLGLGLYAAARATERLGATLEFHVPPDGGTDAVVCIPAEARAPAKQRDTSGEHRST